MEEELFNDLLLSLKQMGQIQRGEIEASRVFVHLPDTVKEIRQKLNMSQIQFAFVMHISVKTLRNWEQGIRKPQGAAIALLMAINNDPENVLAALSAGGLKSPSNTRGAEEQRQSANRR